MRIRLRREHFAEPLDLYARSIWGTLAELTDVLYRYKFDRYVTIEERDEFLEIVVLRSAMLNVATHVSACRDPDDDKFLELAVEARADAIVSGDQDLLVVHPFRVIPILRSADFLTLTDEWSAGRKLVSLCPQFIDNSHAVLPQPLRGG